MARIAGLDIGEKRIGVAISDETETIANCFGTIAVKTTGDSIRRIVDIVSEYNIKEVVVGLPIKMDGSMGFAAAKVNNFVERLREELTVKVSTFDERLTTKEGESVLLKADMSRRKRRQVIDKIAAQIILQTYLDFKKNRG